VSLRELTAAIVLAGGASARFGADKLAAELDGRPLLHHALSAADHVADTIVVVLAPEAVPPVLPRLRARIVVAHDTVLHQGPLAGLAAGLAQLPPGIDRAVLVGGDMPTLVPRVLEALLEALDADPATGAATLEAEAPASLPMAIRPSPVAAAAAALLAEDRRALRGITSRVVSTVVPATTWRPLDPDAQTLRDVDTRGDLRAHRLQRS
jgi:molybdopterin-guanine dinucleotide biosynthesis protein A